VPAVAARHTARGYWLDEAGPVEPAPALTGAVRADVAIVGGGYTGMWTAWQVKRLAPEARVALVEADLCGHGPSGRNGGFANGLWFSLPALRERFGDAAATAVAKAAQDAVEEIGRFCAERQVDAWFRRAGYLQVSTAPRWDGHWRPVIEACRELGEPDACHALASDEIRARCDSPLFRAGALYPGAATVQPARLALGLRTRLREQGVELYERTPAGAVRRRGGELVIDAPAGSVRASAIVLAPGGRLVGRSGMRRRLTLTSSHMLVTEPVPDLLAEIGWTGGECITDCRAMVHYFRTTRDGRIAFGWGGGRVVYGARTSGRAEVDPTVIAELERHLLRFFPGLAGRRIDHAWGGPIDVSPSHLPVIDEIEPGVWCGFGFTGHGVGPSRMVGRSLASLALDRRDEASRLAIVSPPAVRVPPEPFRYLGGTIIRRALLHKETIEERGGRVDAVTRFVAGVPERIGIHVGR
jgi:glycine/D-amino acid oxidase-like deaminating enzyme